MQWIRELFWLWVRSMLLLRYKVTVTGLEKLANLHGPTLVMPNHPGYIDPAIVSSQLARVQLVRPLVYSGTYRSTLFYPLMRLIDAHEVPDLSSHSQAAREETSKMIDSVAEALQAGETILIYPSGRLQRQGREVVGASRAAADLLARCPEANVVLVRSRGIWGSMFSCAPSGGKLPELGGLIVRAFGLLLANLFFFAPRRPVSVQFDLIDRETLPELKREILNPYLEAYYNPDGGEQPTFVPHHFLFGPREFQFPSTDGSLRVELDKIDHDTREAVIEMVEDHLGRPLEPGEQGPDTPLDSLGLDSLDRMDVSLHIEQRFGFRSDEVASTLGELWALAAGQLTADAEQPLEIPKVWNRAVRDPSASVEVLGTTVMESFLLRASISPDDVVVADRTAGVLTYRRLVVGSRLMAKRFEQLEGQAVGVLLPASVAADLAYLGLQSAGKLPVMLNWTTGPAAMSHAVLSLGVRHVVTSRRLIDRLHIEPIEGAEFVFLEDIRGTMRRTEKLRTLIGTYLPGGISPRGMPPTQPDDPAVVLFTSGSESFPKAVPLTHKNLIANARGGAAALGFRRDSVVLGFLPPFHSFGLSANMLLPIIGGMRVVHHPDPTDAVGLARTIAAYRPTMLFTTPTFLSYLLNAAEPGDLQSLELIVTGAEKCPDQLRERCEAMLPQGTVTEGYGITECSPVVSVGRPGQIKPGSIGQTLPNVQALIVDPETFAPLPRNARGLLLVRGESIFNGYLNYDGPNPFVEVNGSRWYNTGDLATMDQEDHLHFRGRLKRFLKVGGEMVSLPALEEPFSSAYPPTEDGHQVAVEGIETPEGRKIVLFAIPEISLRDANAKLAENGFRGVMRLDEVRPVTEIPVLGTGKINYKVLRKQISEGVEAAQPAG